MKKLIKKIAKKLDRKGVIFGKKDNKAIVALLSLDLTEAQKEAIKTLSKKKILLNAQNEGVMELTLTEGFSETEEPIVRKFLKRLSKLYLETEDAQREEEDDAQDEEYEEDEYEDDDR